MAHVSFGVNKDIKETIVIDINNGDDVIERSAKVISLSDILSDLDSNFFEINYIKMDFLFDENDKLISIRINE